MIPLTHKRHDHSLSCLGTGTSINSGGVKVILWTQTSTLSVMMWLCKCFHIIAQVGQFVLLYLFMVPDLLYKFEIICFSGDLSY